MERKMKKLFLILIFLISCEESPVSNDFKIETKFNGSWLLDDDTIQVHIYKSENWIMDFGGKFYEGSINFYNYGIQFQSEGFVFWIYTETGSVEINKNIYQIRKITL
jgi:hypothetical protein